MDFTGTGNSLNVVHPSVLRLIIDSLRYWVTECHVDGFRFDLASALARELYDVDRLSAFFDVIHQDPVLSQVKLIAEPWDVGPGGYQVGNFPVLWTEWNGIYRDAVRDFWRGHASAAQLAERLAGSSDLYEDDGRLPSASINFVTAHDGFTLADLVSYNDKHNEANLEDNRDGTDDNRSWNCGAEGDTDDPEIVELRARQQRNLLTTLLLSQGVPMLLGGDEMGRTQHGNNNAWCQDNELSWLALGPRRRASGPARVHPAADRPAPGPPGVPAPTASSTAARAQRAARRLVVPRRRPPDDPGQLEQPRRAGRRASSSTAPRWTSATSRDEPIVDDSLPGAGQRPLRGRRRSRSRPPAGGASGASSCRPPSRRSRRARGPWRPASRCASPVVRSWCSAAPPLPHREPRSSAASRAARHLPAPAARRVRLPRRPGARALPARPRHLPPLPVPVDDGPAGLDARLRRDRPEPRQRRARWRGGVPRAGRRRAGRRARHRAQPPRRRRPQPVVGRRGGAGAGVRLRPRHRLVPALLRHRRPRRGPPGGSRGLRADPPQGRRAPGRRHDRRAPRRPPRRPRRPRRLPPAARGAGRRPGLGREDPAHRRGAAALAGRRHHRLRVPRRRDLALRRPRRRGGAHRAVRRADRRDPGVRRGGRRGRAGDGQPATFAREVERLAALAERRGRPPRRRRRDRRRRRPGLVARVPHLRRTSPPAW